METIIKDFKKLQASGKVFITKVGNAFVVSVRRFDPATGEETTPSVYAFDVESVEKIKTSAVELIENIDYALAEITKIS